MSLTLDQVLPGQFVEILTIAGEPGLVQRLYELGFCEGERIEFLGRAPLGDPIEIRIANSRISLRKVEAAGIAVYIV